MEFNSDINEIDEVTRKIKIKVPANFVDREITNVTNKYTKKASVKGFRPGKVPVNLVELNYGDQIKSEALSAIIEQTLYKLIEESKLGVVGQPSINVEEFKKGAELSYTAHVSILTPPNLNQYSKLEIKFKKKSVEEKDINQILEKISANKAKITPILDREISASDDVVELELRVANDSESELTGRGEPTSVVLGAGTLPEAVEKEIVGMKIGETKVIKYEVEASESGDKNQRKIYEVKLKALSSRVLPQLSDDLASSLNIGGVTTLDDLQRQIKEELDEEAEKINYQSKSDALQKVLAERHQFKLPEVLIEDEIKRMLGEMNISPEFYKHSIDTKVRELLGGQAEERVRVAVILDRIAEERGLRFDEEELKLLIEEEGKKYGMPSDKFIAELKKHGSMVGFIMLHLRRKVLGTLIEENNFVEE
jgi:trigger factor